MQAIPATGAAMGMQYKEKMKMHNPDQKPPVVVCSIGDASMTEGEVGRSTTDGCFTSVSSFIFSAG